MKAAEMIVSSSAKQIDKIRHDYEYFFGDYDEEWFVEFLCEHDLSLISKFRLRNSFITERYIDTQLWVKSRWFGLFPYYKHLGFFKSEKLALESAKRVATSALLSSTK